MFSPIALAALGSLLLSSARASPVTVNLPTLAPSPVDLTDVLANLKTSPVKNKRDGSDPGLPADPATLPDLSGLPAAPLSLSSLLDVPGLSQGASGPAAQPDVPSLSGLLPAKRSPLDASVPNGLIPSIPGVTEPLSTGAPPLPILQVPTPPLESAPFTPSDIRPKKVGYFWTGAGDNAHKDFLVTTSLDDVRLPSWEPSTLGPPLLSLPVPPLTCRQDTFGTIIDVTDVPTSGNSPHHLTPSLDGKTVAGGGLLSLLKTQDTAFYFDTSDPYRPKFKKSNRAILSSIVDEIRAKPEGYVCAPRLRV